MGGEGSPVRKMTRRAALATGVAIVVAICCGGTLPQSAWPQLAHAQLGGLLPVEPRRATTSDLFPLVGAGFPVRVFESHQWKPPWDGIVVLEVLQRGPVALPDGHTYVVVESWSLARSGGLKRLASVEWMRRAGDDVLCAQRQEGPLRAALVPPQVVLRFPLENGKSWDWEGTAGGLACRAVSRVAGAERVVTVGGSVEWAWRVDCETTAATGDSSSRSVWFAPGLGPVQERTTVRLVDRRWSLDARLVQSPPSSSSR